MRRIACIQQIRCYKLKFINLLSHFRMSSQLIGIIVCILFISCIDDESLIEKNKFDIDSDLALKAYFSNQRGLFVVNEGNFMYDNASLSYYLVDSMKVVNHIFSRVNGVPLGDVAHSMTIHNNLGYIVVNNSGKVYVIDVDNLKIKGKITGLVSPRYIHFVDNTKAYITDLYAKSITIVDLNTLQVTGSISVNNFETEFYQHPTEQMVQIGKKLYVSCWSYDDKILVIDVDSDRLIDSLTVVGQPRSMVCDKSGKVWVLSDGGASGNPFVYERSALTRINPETLEIERIFRFELNDNPLSLCINGSGDTLSLINQHVWQLPITATKFPEKPFISSPYSGLAIGGFYSMAVDPLTSEVYVADAVDNVQQGSVYRFSPNGIAIDTFKVGIIPGNLCFKPTSK